MAITSLREGDKNDYVKILQEFLNRLRYDCGNADGFFGRQTTWAVKWFQKRNGLTADGICGEKTRDALLRANAAKGVPAQHESWHYGIDPLVFFMNAPLWKSYPYDAVNTSGVETVGRTGCGPTTMASILTNLLGKAILPPVLCDWANQRGYRDPKGETGTAPAFFAKCAAEYGLNSASISISDSKHATSELFSQIDHALRSDSLIAASVNSRSPYTSSGHYIMIYKIDNGKVYIKDPVERNNRITPQPIRSWIDGQWAKRFIRIGK